MNADEWRRFRDEKAKTELNARLQFERDQVERFLKTGKTEYDPPDHNPSPELLVEPRARGYKVTPRHVHTNTDKERVIYILE